jgi:hypothetical protein
MSSGPTGWPAAPPVGPELRATGPTYTPVGPTALLPEVDRARRQTRTGLLLLTIGFALAWIPVIQDLGSLLALVGVLYLFAGRWGFTERHHDLVLTGGVLLVVSFLATIIVAVALVSATLQAATQAGATSQTVGATLESAIQNAAIAAFVVGLLGTVGEVLMVYTIADRTSRALLIAGFFSAIVIGIAIYAVEQPLLSNAIEAATSGPTIDLGPINSYQDQVQLYGLLQVVPSLIIAGAYYLIWQKVDREIRSTAPVPTYY